MSTGGGKGAAGSRPQGFGATFHKVNLNGYPRAGARIGVRASHTCPSAANVPSHVVLRLAGEILLALVCTLLVDNPTVDSRV